MDKIETITDSIGVEHVITYREDGSFISMLKSTYDKQQAEQADQSIGGNI
jgi:hypothetical protein